MKISIKTNFDLNRLDIGKVTQIGLVNSSQELVRMARQNAPYDTGTLKKGIGAEPGNISTSTTSTRVGPRGIVYAVRREFENKKNPTKKFYMKRTSEKAPAVVKEEFGKAVQIVERSIKK